MKFRCERDVLVEALSTAGRAVAGRSGALPVLGGVRLSTTGDTLQVTGTDLDLTITVETVVNGGADGVAVAPGRLITDIVRALEPGAVAVDADDEEIRIASGRSHFSVRTHPAGDFPRLPVPTGETVTLPVAGLTEALRQVTRAASNEDSRPILTGRADGGRRGRAAPGCDGLLPAGRSGPAGRRRAGGGPAGPGAVAGAQRAHAAAGIGERGGDPSPGATRCHLHDRGGGPDHPPDRGGVPQLPPADPVGLPEPTARGPGAVDRGGPPGQAAGPRRHHPGAHRPAPDRDRADGDHHRLGHGHRGSWTPSTRGQR